MSVLCRYNSKIYVCVKVLVSAKKSSIFGFLILNNNRVPGPLKLLVLLRNLEFLLKLQVWYNLHTYNLFLFVKFWPERVFGKIGNTRLFRLPLFFVKSEDNALWFFLRITCFFTKKKCIAISFFLKERIAIFALFVKGNKSDSLFLPF